MPKIRYFECQNCGRIHYGITQKEADEIIKSGRLSDEFNMRSLKHCSNCGLSYPFIEVSEFYAKNYSHGGKLEPWLYPKEADEPATTTANQP